MVFPKFHNLTFGLLQIKNTHYSGSVTPIFMHFGQEFSELCLVSFCCFYFGIWWQVTLYEKDNKCDLVTLVRTLKLFCKFLLQIIHTMNNLIGAVGYL